jgi:UDP-glucose 4-epimerase
MKAERVLVTGGAGFIGSHLCDQFLARGACVTVIDDLSTGRWENIAHLEHAHGFRSIIGSADDAGLLAQEVPKHDIVYHLASAVGVKLVMDRPVHTVQCIVDTTSTVLKQCSRYRRPVVITSTSEVYGRSARIPFSEENDLVIGASSKRRWAYACAKALDEFLAMAYFHETRLPVYVARLFNTVGPRQSGQYGMVLPRFVQQALAGDPITVHGDGTQQRCFAHVNDVVEALVRLPAVETAAGKAINIGSQEEVTIRELALRVQRACGSAGKIVYIPVKDAYGPAFDDVQRRVPDLERARKLLGWAPKCELDAIVADVVNYYRQHMAQAQSASEAVRFPDTTMKRMGDTSAVSQQ